MTVDQMELAFGLLGVLVVLAVAALVIRSAIDLAMSKPFDCDLGDDYSESDQEEVPEFFSRLTLSQALEVAADSNRTLLKCEIQACKLLGVKRLDGSNDYDRVCDAIYNRQGHQALLGDYNSRTFGNRWHSSTRRAKAVV